MELSFRKIGSRTFKQIRETWFEALFGVFGYIPRRIRDGRGVRVLIYHGICKSTPLKFNSRFLSQEQFEAHLKLIKRCYNPISFQDHKHGNLSADKLNVLITFDDGLKNNFEQALPLLLKYDFPAVFFICTGRDKDHLFNDVVDVFSAEGPDNIVLGQEAFTKAKKGVHYRYMHSGGARLAEFFHRTRPDQREELIKQVLTWMPLSRLKEYGEYVELMDKDQINIAAKQELITLGSHGISHADLTCLSKDELVKELSESRQALNGCDLIAFPYGSYNTQVVETCRKEGYNYFFGTEKLNDPADRSLIIERFTVNPFVSAINQMYYLAKNNYE